MNIRKNWNGKIRKLIFVIVIRSLYIDSHYAVFYSKTKYKVTSRFFIYNDVQ